MYMVTFVSGSTSSTKRKAMAMNTERRKNVPAMPGSPPQLEPIKSGVAMAMVNFPIQLAAVVMDIAVPGPNDRHIFSVKMHSCMLYTLLTSDI